MFGLPSSQSVRRGHMPMPAPLARTLDIVFVIRPSDTLALFYLLLNWSTFREEYCIQLNLPYGSQA